MGLGPKKDDGPMAVGQKSVSEPPKSVGTQGGTGAISSLSPINPAKGSAANPPLGRRVSMPVKVARVREKLPLISPSRLP